MNSIVFEYFMQSYILVSYIPVWEGLSLSFPLSLFASPSLYLMLLISSYAEQRSELGDLHCLSNTPSVSCCNPCALIG